jgi:hypothetical protein
VVRPVSILVRNKTRVVEIVGPAAAGKTTLLRALCEQQPGISPGTGSSRIAHAPFWIAASLKFLPLYLRKFRHTRWFTWRELRSMVYLEAWRHRTSHTPREHPITVFDHGPIYRLVLLRAFGPELTRQGSYLAWWECQLKHWARMLDLVIWLDAPNHVLIERVNSRHTGHNIKGKYSREAFEFLDRYRTWYELVMSEITFTGKIQSLRFDTSRQETGQVTAEVMQALNPESHAC